MNTTAKTLLLRPFLRFLAAGGAMLVLLVTVWGLVSPGPVRAAGKGGKSGVIERLKLTEEEWRQRLTPEEFKILREEGTERAGTSPLNREKREGTYVCAGCGLELFHSKHKFESGTGWPSFFDAIKGHVATKRDFKLFIPRTEYHCARCGGHQGHVFEDGPPPTGLRYCNNGLALDFVPAKPQP